MRTTLIACMVILVLSGCATMNYEGPDGEKISYMRLGTTTDKIEATSTEGRTIKVQGQGISPELRQALQMVIGALTLGEIK